LQSADGTETVLPFPLWSRIIPWKVFDEKRPEIKVGEEEAAVKEAMENLKNSRRSSRFYDQQESVLITLNGAWNSSQYLALRFFHFLFSCSLKALVINSPISGAAAARIGEHFTLKMCCVDMFRFRPEHSSSQ
jgi:hypothetical protein